MSFNAVTNGEEILYDIDALSQGSWVSKMTTADREEALSEAGRLSKKGRYAGVRVRAERYDPKKELFVSEMIYQRTHNSPARTGQSRSQNPGRGPGDLAPAARRRPDPGLAREARRRAYRQASRPGVRASDWALAGRAGLAIGVIIIGAAVLMALHQVANGRLGF